MRLILTTAAFVLILSGCNSGGSGLTVTPSSPWPRFRHDSAHTGAGIGRVASPRGTPSAVPVDASPPLSPVLSSPALGIDGAAYALSKRGTLIAVRNDGTVKWRTAECSVCNDGNLEIGTTLSSPTLFAPPRGAVTIYFGSESGRIYGFEDRTDHGACTLCFNAPEATPELVGARFSAPVTLLTHVATGKVVQIFASAGVRRPGSNSDEGRIVSISPSGDLLWLYPRLEPYPSPFVTSIAIGASSSAVAGSADGTLHVLSLLQAGEPLWRFFVGPFQHPDTPVALAPVTAGGVVYALSTNGRVLALSNAGGSQMWERTLPRTELAASLALGVQALPGETPTPMIPVPLTPTTATPTMPEPSPESSTPSATPTTTPTPTPTPIPLGLTSSLFILTKDGRFLALDARNGADAPTGDVQQAIDGDVLSSPALSLDAYLVFGSTAGTLYAIENRSGLAAWPPIALAPGVPIRSSPAIAADGTIWVGADNGYLYRVGGQ